MFNLAIASKLRGCDLVRLRVSDVVLGSTIRLRTSIIQQKTGRPVPFELTDPTREALTERFRRRPFAEANWLFPSRSRNGNHITTQ
jgi:integrase